MTIKNLYIILDHKNKVESVAVTYEMNKLMSDYY